jgi:hypothetical protein
MRSEYKRSPYSQQLKMCKWLLGEDLVYIINLLHFTSHLVLLHYRFHRLALLPLSGDHWEV